MWASLVLEVEAVAGLDLGVFLFHGEMELVVADGGVGLVGGVAEDVLIAEFFVEVSVDFVESLFLGDFKETAAGSFGDLFENCFAVGARFFRAAGMAAASAAHSAAAHSTTTHARSAEAAAAAVAFFLVGEENAINQGIGALRGFDGFGERFLAATVDAVGKDDESLAALLLFH